MSEFDYKIISRPGVQNGNSDALSRIPNQPEETQEIDDEPTALHATALRQKWMEDPAYADIYL